MDWNENIQFSYIFIVLFVCLSVDFSFFLSLSGVMKCEDVRLLSQKKESTKRCQAKGDYVLFS